MARDFRTITQAYWPSDQKNPPANIEAGNKEVDSLTLGELTSFFGAYTRGPTYCLVKRRVLEQLEKLPSALEIKSAKQQASDALASLAIAARKLESQL